MKIFGLLLAVIAGWWTWVIVGEGALHNYSGGFFPGVVVAAWVAWTFLYKHSIGRFNFLHPAPRQYNLNAQHAFHKIRELLSESVYNYGDKWRVSMADVQTNRIVAEMQFRDEHTKFDVNLSRGQFHARKEQRKCYLKLEVQMKTTEDGSTVVQFDFYPRAESGSEAACDAIIDNFVGAVDGHLGAGMAVAQPLSAKLPEPPNWLLGTTMLMLAFLFIDVVKAVCTQ